MIRGDKILLLSSILAAAGCGKDQNVQVRAIPQPGAKFNYGGDLMAQARTELSLGSVGLALESFRKLQLEQPDNPEVFAGIAACYAAMGRYDLTRANYEYALAYAPNNASLLTALASTLDRLGEAEQASQVRAEVAQLTAKPKVQQQIAQEAATSLGVPRVASVTVKLPAVSAPTREPKLAETPQAVEIPIAPPRQSTVSVNLPAARPLAASRFATIAAVDVPSLAPPPFASPASPPTVPVAPVQPAVLVRQAIAPEIGKPQFSAAPIHLAPMRPVMPNKPAFNLPAIELAASVEAPAPVKPAAPQVPAKRREAEMAQAAPSPAPATNAPHLERLSRGEVSLLTARNVTWSARRTEPQVAVRTGKESVPQPYQRRVEVAALRWIPLKYASAPSNIEILNAARNQGLAARTRIALLNRGWRKIGIGNAKSVRQRSLVLYSAGRVGIARRLAAQFRCKALKVPGVQSVVVLLGRDVMQRRPASERA